jgi:hypothetical protein
MKPQTLRPEQHQGVCVLLSSALAELRRIKTAESHWVDRYLVVSATVIATSQMPNAVQHWGIWLLPAHLLVLFWFESTLLKERLSYYRTARTVVRYQRLLGLIESGLVPEHHAHPYPEGFCPDSKHDGTRRTSSFLGRLTLLAGTHVLVCMYIIMYKSTSIVAITTSILSMCSILGVLRLDKVKMIQECHRELQLPRYSTPIQHDLRVRA